MSWLTEYVRPRIKRLVRPSDVPDGAWVNCPNCGTMLYTRELDKNQKVCQHCGHHMRMGAKERLESLFDGGAYERIQLPDVVADPLKFRDLKRYTDRHRDAERKTGEKDAIVVAHGTIGGAKAVVAAFDFAFMGGSMGMAVGEGVVAAAELALLQRVPLITVPASGGARMQEGILSLMQMARTTVAISRLREKGLPHIVVLTDPTTGGVTASFAMLGDIHIAEPGAVIGFAGARVIEQTIRQKLPEGFQRAEYLLEHGMVDMVVHRHQLAGRLASLVDLFGVRQRDVGHGPMQQQTPLPALKRPVPPPEAPAPHGAAPVRKALGAPSNET